ncbi:MAG: penicillin-binding protein activator [Gammaproteobacteria bacterium]|nr:penicillin-binding protein activator [Gammaproteobacteria bacterium]
MNWNIKFFLLLVISALLSSCASGPEQSQLNPDDAEQLLARGEYHDASKLFVDIAKQLSSQKRAPYLLRATAAQARLGNVIQSKRILKSIQLDAADPVHITLFYLTEAHIALAERQTGRVFEILDNNPPMAGINRFYLADYHDLRADAYHLSGNRIETARELIQREHYLRDPEIIRANQQDIWQSLSMLTERALLQLRTDPPPNILSGWMDLVRITKTYQLRPEMLQQALQQWRQTYPSHPADQTLIDDLRSRKPDDVTIPERIALLLPFSSKFARAAEAIRDGFFAAYYSNKTLRKQSIRVYDVGEMSQDITNIYQQAINEGAQFVVGPLHKDSINALAETNSLPVPTLGLNYSRNENIPANLYQFGLSPEEEARQVAERTWLDGYINAAVLVPAGPWGERVAQAFNERWQEVGGRIVSQQNYNSTDKDFSRPIRTLLNINQSQQRYRSLSNLLNRKLKFTPRRRNDIDFIFMAAYPRQARQIRPQLKFYHASTVPVYATSHAFTGNLNPERDRDMDGLVFGDMPWVLSDSTTHRSLRSQLESDISKAGNSLQRLYALGIDAYNIIGALNPLKQYTYERYDGETGSLSLDLKQRIQRQVTWVKFRSGRPVLVDQEL